MQMRARVLAGLLLAGLLTACADPSSGPLGATQASTKDAQASGATPDGSDPDTTDPASACPDGIESFAAIDYGAPSKGMEQSVDEALEAYNDYAKRTYEMTPEGWAVARDDQGVVVSVITFSELMNGYFVVGGELGCRPEG